MKVTLLGHASIFVEMRGARCLMDPVFQDPFEDTAVVSCPRRSIDLAAIPPIDLLVISHNHLDHFDIPSLAHIAKASRTCEVLCPKEKAITYALERLGFTNIHAEDSMKRFKLGEYELMTTPSNVSNVIEFGIVFKDRSGTFWNQVDTIVAPETVAPTLAQSGKIDLLFAMYASQNFNFFESRGSGFPHGTHEMNLRNVMAIAPRMTVPGSAGFRFAGPGMDWCNAFLFPMSRERFLGDLNRVAPSLATRSANPGDVFEIDGGTVTYRAQASAMAKTLEDDTHLLRFDPTATIPPLQDPNPAGVASADLTRAVDECLEAFAAFINDAYLTSDPVVDEYRACRASYSIGVVFPDGPERWLRIELGEHGPTFARTDGASAPSDAGHRIVASALTAWNAREKSYFYLRAFSRKWTTLFSLAMKDGKATIVPNDARDLLAYYLERKAKGAELALKLWLDYQLAPFVSGKS